MYSTSPRHEPAPIPAPAAVAEAFLTPARRPATRVPGLPDAQFALVPTRYGPVATYRAGAGSPVLLVHGWESDAGDLQVIAAALRRRGLAVLAVDLPAHGRSGGQCTSVPDSAQAVLEVQRHVGAMRAVVGHSIGGAVVVEAMARGLETACAVLLASPSRYRDVARRFGTALGLNDQGVNELFSELARRGIDLDRISVADAAPAFGQPALFVHSEDDGVVPISDAVVNAMAWPQGRLLRRRGLGHRRLLRDAEVVESVVSFIERTTAPTRVA